MLFTNVWTMWTTSLRCWWPNCSLDPKKYDSTSLTPPNFESFSRQSKLLFHFILIHNGPWNICGTCEIWLRTSARQFNLQVISIPEQYSIIFTLLNNTIVPTFIYFLSVNPWTGLIMECSIAYGLLDKNRFSIWNLDFQFWIEFELNPTKPHYATGPSSLEWNHKNK